MVLQQVFPQTAVYLSFFVSFIQVMMRWHTTMGCTSRLETQTMTRVVVTVLEMSPVVCGTRAVVAAN